jgi:phosphatidate cytidylyltransferase
MASNMTKRVGFAVVAIPLLGAAVWVGGWALAALLMVAAFFAIGELFELAAHHEVRPFPQTGWMLAVAIPIVLAMGMQNERLLMQLRDWWPYAVVLAGVWTGALAVFTRSPADKPLASVAITLFGVFYVSVLPCSLFFIRHAQWGLRSWPGTAAVFFPLLVTWVCDSAAMIAGKRFGRARMAPSISPGKTWVGGISGVVAGVIVGAAYAIWIFPPAAIPIGVVSAALLAAALAVVGQIGDLAESLFKREAGVKDSSALIPGHGGVLDRLDSLYFVLPVCAAGYHVLGLL